MISRLATMLSQLTLSPARRIFALQQMLIRAEAVQRTDIYTRIYHLLEQELILLRDTPKAPATMAVGPSESDVDDGRNSAFISLVNTIANDDPSPQVTHLLEPVYEQLQRLSEFRSRPSQALAPR